MKQCYKDLTVNTLFSRSATKPEAMVLPANLAKDREILFVRVE
jgi:hypothetical protein